MIKIIIAGIAGKMGKMIFELAQASPDMTVVAGLEQAGHPDCTNVKSTGLRITSDTAIMKEADVVIDFTAAGAAMKNIHSAVAAKKPIVIGTTGFSKEQLKEIKEAAQKIPVFLSPNMSPGVHLLNKLVEITSQALSNYDIEIIETHHNKKKDAPSGTAVKLADIISKIIDTHDTCYGRKGNLGQRPHKQIGIHAVRAGDIVGEHTVVFAGPGERIELTHKADSRAAFAAGSLCAALWIYGKKPGLYGMENMLGEA
ncbi:MAG: 4-hydroxy-tetrahydrodipicolinate reductase [bacterium]